MLTTTQTLMARQKALAAARAFAADAAGKLGKQ